MDKSQIQSEALTAIGNNTRAGVAASMGAGKTFIGIQHMDMNYNDSCRFLIVGHRKTVLKAWKEDMVKFKRDHLMDHIKFSTYNSLSKQDLDYDVIYLDECHNLKFTHDSWLSKFKGKILGLTGTPPKNPMSERGKMVGKYCPIVFEYKTDDAVKDGILNDYRIIVHHLYLDRTRTLKVKKRDGGFFYTSEYDNYEFWSGMIEDAPPARVHLTRLMRMKAMQTFPSKEKYADILFKSISDKCILFTNTKEQADRLCNFSYHSTNPNSEHNLDAFKRGIISKISAVQQLSESVNVPNLKAGVIMHAFGNERVASQKIGRMLRLNPKDTATIHILCYKDTVDEEWVRLALEHFDQTKISYK